MPELKTFSTDAVVTVGEIPRDDRSGFFVDDGDDATIFTDYLVTNQYEGNPHIYMMGVTSPSGFLGNSAAFVQFAAPTVLWIVDWTASRLNKPPLVPGTTPNDKTNWIFLGDKIELGMITVAPDGRTPLYRVSGTYWYGCLNTANVDLTFPNPPWLDGDFTRELGPEFFAQGIID